MLWFIAQNKIPAGTVGYADNYVIKLARDLCCPKHAFTRSIHYDVKVRGDIDPLSDVKLISKQLRQPALSGRSCAMILRIAQIAYITQQFCEAFIILFY